MVALLCTIGILIGVILILIVKIHYMHKSMQEMCVYLQQYADVETNILIDLPSHDRYVRALGNAINRELRLLRKQRNQYLRGDYEVKEAITNISHDLRTPLTAICGYMDLLKKEPHSDAVQKYLAIIDGRIDAMKSLTEELFCYSVNISAENMLRMEQININSVLEEAIAAQYTDLCCHNIIPDIRIPDSAVIRNLNREALARVFGNLISNAVRYSDGDLSIRLSEDGTVVFSNTASNLNEVQVGKLLDRFYTVESAHRSTGLGLSIAKALTEQMGGQIQASHADNRLSITVSFALC